MALSEEHRAALSIFLWAGTTPLLIEKQDRDVVVTPRDRKMNEHPHAKMSKVLATFGGETRVAELMDKLKGRVKPEEWSMIVARQAKLSFVKVTVEVSVVAP